MDRPIADQPHYGEHLGDAEYWEPYVLSALQTCGLPAAPLEAPFVGSFPTFLVGDLVVKLFGPNFDGLESCAAEQAMHNLLLAHPQVPAPALIASGCLYDHDHPWPFLVTRRLRGAAFRDITRSVAVALELGEALARVHALESPDAVADRDLIPRLRSTASDRVRSFGLPEHLAAQVQDYLADAPPPSMLVHADVTADHVFVLDGRLEGVIDWGDAIVADPYYELVAVYFDAFDARPELLDAFLDGYGWQRDGDFARRALHGVLTFQFNAIGRIAQLVDLNGVASLDELAERLYR